MKRSTLLYLILAVLFTILILAGLFVPQSVLDENEIYFLLIVVPLMGWMWLQAYKDSEGGN
jgi:hypothetical protein